MTKHKDPFAEAVERAIADLPPHLRSALGHLAIFIEDLPDEETLARVGVDRAEALLGLFEGMPLTEQQASPPSGKLPERIRLFRRAILAHCAFTGESIEACVRTTILHELGHFFGLTDDDLASYGL